MELVREQCKYIMDDHRNKTQIISSSREMGTGGGWQGPWNKMPQKFSKDQAIPIKTNHPAFHLGHCNYMVFWPPSHFHVPRAVDDIILWQRSQQGDAGLFLTFLNASQTSGPFFTPCQLRTLFYQIVTRNTDHNLYELHQFLIHTCSDFLLFMFI